MSIKTFKTLYKKNSTGKIQFWSIRVVVHSKNASPVIETQYGIKGGKIIDTEDVISEGKNVGRSNETTPLEQALAEAKSKWTKKLKSGYVESLKAANEGATDKVIKGGILPMLAYPMEKAKKFEYPCLIQPKLDGIRCVAIIDGVGKEGVTLWTKTRKRITSCVHIEKALTKRFNKLLKNRGFLILDGELYNHELRHEFEEIVSAVRRKEPSELSLKVEYHVYDVISSLDQAGRHAQLNTIFRNQEADKILHVETYVCPSKMHVEKFSKGFVKRGYEGGILRAMKALYENKRTYSLLKVVEYQEDEFFIVGIEEGRGKLQGHVGAFVCETEEGKEFKAKLEGKLVTLRHYFINKDDAIGKLLTVKFRGKTKNNIPRFPVGKAIREGGL